MAYEHVQYGPFGAVVIVVMVVVTVFTLPEMFDQSTLGGWLFVGTLVGITVLMIVFSRLTVRVEGGVVTASFGLGSPRRTIDLSDVEKATAVRNSWIQGWGIRRIRDGWMYNVWGLDAVEFEMTSGKRARIGTNDLDNFLATIAVYTG